MITQYALCGLSYVGVMGMMLGNFGGMAPRRMDDLTQLVFSGMVAGNVACFMTGCVSGESFVLYYIKNKMKLIQHFESNLIFESRFSKKKDIDK